MLYQKDNLRFIKLKIVLKQYNILYTVLPFLTSMIAVKADIAGGSKYSNTSASTNK